MIIRRKDSCYTRTIIEDFEDITQLFLTPNSVPINTILDSTHEICILKKELIKISTGYKLMIKGSKNIKIRYTAIDTCEKIYTKSFSIPFFNLIDIPPGSYIKDISIKLDYCNINKVNSLTLWFYNILLVKISILINNTSPTLECSSNRNNTNYFSHKKNPN